MNKKNLNTTGSVLIFLGMTSLIFAFFYVIIANGTPQEEHAMPEPKEYTFDDPTTYRYPCGVTGSLRHCIKHKQKGVELLKLDSASN